MAVAEVERRGSIRHISDLPTIVGTPDWLEGEKGGVPGKISGASLAPSLYFQKTIWQLSLGATPFVDDRGNTVSTTGPVVFDPTTNPPSAKFPTRGSTGQGIHIAQSSPKASDDIGAMTMFTLEGWFKTSETSQQFTAIASRDTGTAPSGAWSLFINNGSASDGKLAFYGVGFGAQPVLVSTSAYNDGVRHHVAIVQRGAWWGMWVDGTLVATNDVSISIAAVLAADTILGGANEASREFIGSLDNWRLVADAIYAGGKITVPTPPFPTS